MKSFFQRIWENQTIMRILMNEEFKNFFIRGRVVDIGGGRNPDYFNYFKKEGVISITPVDASISQIDFEKDLLPFSTNSIDTVVCANVLEHVFNHRFLVNEIMRILTPGGVLVGFVPFLIQYHPDPHDYFRYTNEALLRILFETGFKNGHIVTVSRGPFTAGFNSLMLSIPRVFRIIGVPISLVLDGIYAKFKPNIKVRYPLGYIFTAKK